MQITAHYRNVVHGHKGFVAVECRRFVFIHQVAALFVRNVLHSRHLESVTLNRKSVSVNY